MNCREAENLIFAARDGALDETQRATLAQHLAGCGECRTMQAELEASADAWRASDVAARVPAIEVEWHAIRRRIRGEAPATAGAIGFTRWLRPLAWTFSTAAAAVALALFVAPEWFRGGRPAGAAEPGYVSYVKVFNTSDETMVYEDQESGWLVVWVANDPEQAGT